MNKYIERLYNEWSKHKQIIIGVDFDDTISPYNFNDLYTCQKVVDLLIACKSTGAYIVIHTACNKDRYKEIQEYCKDLGLIIDSINITPISLPYGKDGSKPYCNIFIDDRAGINEALNMLSTALYLRRSDIVTEQLSIQNLDV